MKQIILNIEESKFKAFLTFIKTLDYVSVSKQEAIPEWQQKEVSKRLQLIEKGEMKTRSWQKAKKDIFWKVMSYTIAIAEAAEDDLREVYLWYEEQKET